MDFWLIFSIFLWNVFGAAFCAVWSHNKYTDGWELCNPYWAYRYHKGVNVFGAIMISLFYTALCPIGALCYWFYKLCTVGRR